VEDVDEIDVEEIAKDSKIVISAPLDAQSAPPDEYSVKLGPEVPDRTHFAASSAEVAEGVDDVVVQKHAGLWVTIKEMARRFSGEERKKIITLHLHRLLNHNVNYLRRLKRLAHISGFSDIVQYIDLRYVRQCLACQNARMRFELRGREKLRCDKAGEVVQFDFIIFQTPSFDKKKVVLQVVDRFSGYIWSFALRFRKEATACLTTVRNEIGVATGEANRLRMAICDQDALFVGGPFYHAAAKLGVRLAFSASHSHLDNSCIERCQQRLQSQLRSCMMQAGLPDKYWTLFVAPIVLHKMPHYYIQSYYCTIHNHMPISGGPTENTKTPYELLYSEPTWLRGDQLRPFGEVTYLATSMDRITSKLQLRGVPRIFVGVSKRAEIFYDLFHHQHILASKYKKGFCLGFELNSPANIRKLEQNRLDELKVTDDSAIWLATEVNRQGVEPFIWTPSFRKQSLSKRNASSILPANDDHDELVQPRITAEHQNNPPAQLDAEAGPPRRQTRSMTRGVNSLEVAPPENGWFDLATDIPWSETREPSEWDVPGDSPSGSLSLLDETFVYHLEHGLNVVD